MRGLCQHVLHACMLLQAHVPLQVQFRAGWLFSSHAALLWQPTLRSMFCLFRRIAFMVPEEW